MNASNPDGFHPGLNDSSATHVDRSLRTRVHHVKASELSSATTSSCRHTFRIAKRESRHRQLRGDRDRSQHAGGNSGESSCVGRALRSAQV